jgi:outer membrane protein assembly factor BamD (BamD/ComL family)
MDQPSWDKGDSQLRMSRVVAFALTLAALALGVSGVAWAVVRLATTWNAVSASWLGVIGVLGRMLLLWCGAVLLWGVGAAVSLLDELHQLALRQASAPAASGAATPERQTLADLRVLLAEIRDLTLLDGQQRAKRLQLQAAEAARRLEREVPQLLQEHNWAAARERLQVARERFPTLPQWDTLAAQIEQARTSVESRDIESATRQVEELAAPGAWDRAWQVVQDLLARHPDAPAARELARRVTREREKVGGDECRRLLAQAQAATDRRDWVAALQLARTLLDRFPQTPEAEGLRTQVPTLSANAEVQTRQQMEGDIRDLIREHRFAEALNLARTLIAHYPQSPQAGVLREQLARLEQRAAEQPAAR